MDGEWEVAVWVHCKKCGPCRSGIYLLRHCGLRVRTCNDNYLIASFAASSKFLSPSPKATSAALPMQPTVHIVGLANPGNCLSPIATSPTYSNDSLASPRAEGSAEKAKLKRGQTAEADHHKLWRNPGDHARQHQHLEAPTLASAQHAADELGKAPRQFLHGHHADFSRKSESTRHENDEVHELRSRRTIRSARAGGDGHFEASLRDLSVLEKQLDAALESQRGASPLALPRTEGQDRRALHADAPEYGNDDLKHLEEKLSKAENDLKVSEEIRQADEIEKEIARRERSSLASQVETLCAQRDQLVQENQMLLQAQKERKICDEESEQDLQRSVEALRVSKESMEQSRQKQQDLEQVWTCDLPASLLLCSCSCSS